MLATSYFLTHYSTGKSNYKTGIHREALCVCEKNSTFSQHFLRTSAKPGTGDTGMNKIHICSAFMELTV